MGRDDGGGEAEVCVVVENLLVDGLVVDGDGDERDLGAGGGFAGEEAPVEVFVGRGGFLSPSAGRNWMRTSSRSRGSSRSFWMMTRTGRKPWET